MNLKQYHIESTENTPQKPTIVMCYLFCGSILALKRETDVFSINIIFQVG